MSFQAVFRVGQYLRHWWVAQDAHSLHSPSIYTLYTEVILAAKKGHPRSEITALYQALSCTHDTVSITDFGTGQHRSERISKIAKSSHQPATGRLLYHLASFIKPKYILELGANIGLGTINLGLAAPEAEIHTLEGCPSLGNLATRNFQKLGLNNIILHNQRIESGLPEVLPLFPRLDLIYFDANHQYKATLENFELCLPYCKQSTVLVIDDIYWSRGMKQAWEWMQQHPRANTCLDLYHLGVIFFDPAMPPGTLVLEF